MQPILSVVKRTRALGMTLAVAGATTAALMGGCGQKGPLTLPASAAASAPASAASSPR